MRIGIDLDDTVCRTTEMVHKYLQEYASEKKLDPLDIMNEEDLRIEFFNKKLEDIYSNVEIKREVMKVIKRLKTKGNEIYIITSRSKNNPSNNDRIAKITKKWLKEHEIEADKVIFDAYGETKADICKKYKVDLMIDDDPYNYKQIISLGKKCLLFDDREKYNLEKDYVTNWLQVEKFIERNR